MNLYQYDSKHETVHKQLRLDNLSQTELDKLETVLTFINENQSRYTQYMIAKGYTIEYSDDFPFINWIN